MSSAVIASDRLMVGDVLLYRGRSMFAEIIRLLDESDVNHAALYRGGDRVAEALGQGLVERDLSASLRYHEWVLVRRIRTPGLDTDPVQVRASALLKDGHQYPNEQLLLLAFLLTTRKLPVGPTLSRLLPAIFDSAALLIARVTAQGKDPMICSEFVFRCFEEASPSNPDAYRLPIESTTTPGARGAVALPGGSRVRVHPESLLVTTRRLGIGAASENAAPAGPAVLVAPEIIDEMVEKYLLEVRRVRSESLAEILQARNVQDAFLRFSLALGESKRGTAMRRSVIAEDALIYTESAVAEFVTPGDLLRTLGLTDVGRIESGAEGA